MCKSLNVAVNKCITDVLYIYKKEKSPLTHGLNYRSACDDVIAPTAQAATPAITFPSLPCNEAALPSPSSFLVVMF